MAGLCQKFLFSRITKARNTKERQDHNKKEDAFEGGQSLVKEDTEELAEKGNVSTGSGSACFVY